MPQSWRTPLAALAVALALVPVAPTLALAADAPPPAVIDSWTMWLKEGHAPQFEAAVKAHLAWRKSAGEGYSWDAYQPVVGADLTHIVFRAGPFQWSDLDAHTDWGLKSGAGAKFNETVAPHVARMQHQLAALDHKHSLWPDGQYRYFGVTALRLKPGGNAAMMAALERIHKVATDAKWSRGYSLQWVIGGDGADVVFVNPFKSYADMAEPEPSFMKVLSDRLASESAASGLWTDFVSTFEPGSYSVYAARPDLSTPK